MKKTIGKIVSWIIILGAIGFAVWGMVKLASLPKIDRSAPDTTVYDLKIGPTDWVKGNRDARVVLVEYSDFQCPACGFYYPLLKQLTEEFGDRVAVVYRHFPLKQIHKNAVLAAQAAEAAGLRGKFWEMHNLLFENQSIWSKALNPKSTFTEYAKRIGLNEGKFESDLESRDTKNKVDMDYIFGAGLGINSTPTFFLNGRKLINPRSYEEFKQIIEKAVAENSVTQ